jgi:hypothetical protein
VANPPNFLIRHTKFTSKFGIRINDEAILAAGRGGPYGCETSRLPHLLDSLLTDCCHVVSLTRRQVFTRRKVPGTHFCYRMSQPQGHSGTGKIWSIEKSIDFIGNRIRDLGQLRYLVGPNYVHALHKWFH